MANYAAQPAQRRATSGCSGIKPKLDPAALADEIRRARIERIVLAGDSPGYFKPAFTRAMATIGGNPDEVRLASFREHGAGAGRRGPERAKAIVACAVHGVPFTLVAVPQSTAVNQATLVIGGGIAGIQAALEIADAGKKVYLVERSATIGGHMAMFDKTFPTLDCAACILTPKMVAVGEHEMIELLTLSEVQEVTRQPRRLPRQGARSARAGSTSTPASPATPARRSARSRVWSEFDSQSDPPQGHLHPVPAGRAQRLRRRPRAPALGCRATARSAAPA